jgi:hypothetical protein
MAAPGLQYETDMEAEKRSELVRGLLTGSTLDGEAPKDAGTRSKLVLVLQPGFMVVRSSVPMSSAGTLLMSSAPG